jgi:hypothetical protein
MPLLWFLAGVLTTLASLVVILPWLRRSPRFGNLPAFPRIASVGAVVIVAASFGLYGWLGHPAATPHASAPSANNASDNAAGTFASAAKLFDDAKSAPADTVNRVDPAKPPAKAAAGSMDTAIANLESRLSKGGGSAEDWELLAKSFEFLDRPADAAKARARQLPPLGVDADAPAAGPAVSMAPSTSVISGTAVSGEVTLAPALRSKAAAGETLFIVAKSVDSPGAPVAVFRGSVGSWPLKFSLDDSQSMLPGRNLSSAGRVTVEARISRKGQPLPAAGDLQGSSGVINPADHQLLKILIDRVIT